MGDWGHPQLSGRPESAVPKLKLELELSSYCSVDARKPTVRSASRMPMRIEVSSSVLWGVEKKFEFEFKFEFKLLQVARVLSVVEPMGDSPGYYATKPRPSPIGSLKRQTSIGGILIIPGRPESAVPKLKLELELSSYCSVDARKPTVRLASRMQMRIEVSSRVLWGVEKKFEFEFKFEFKLLQVARVLSVGETMGDSPGYCVKKPRLSPNGS
ncbi:hypothetical protein K227x_43830 [Rubripirellula lacrimiformis]|uniref:Uncharacterized protein n=1 Tax=Rubripirellula lacrimiformis TaxID=1930273 RepID=A0A517NFQ2_9BACT|nr:hypothetical protein [Rubripirellula lacrimiformis]QDT05976.1 hypothetical protein K227x_43830 [Rubripirellula lacrimiformis]